jgi:hypothetical protein
MVAVGHRLVRLWAVIQVHPVLLCLLAVVSGWEAPGIGIGKVVGIAMLVVIVAAHHVAWSRSGMSL